MAIPARHVLLVNLLTCTNFYLRLADSSRRCRLPMPNTFTLLYPSNSKWFPTTMTITLRDHTASCMDKVAKQLTTNISTHLLLSSSKSSGYDVGYGPNPNMHSSSIRGDSRTKKSQTKYIHALLIAPTHA